MKTPEIGTLEPVPSARLVPEGEDGFAYGEGASEQGFVLQSSVYFFAPSELTLSRLTSPRNP